MKKGLVFTAVVCAISMGLVACKKQAPAPTLESISVTAPTKTVYTVGDTFDPSGMVVTANFSDQSTQVVEEGYTYTNPDMNTIGQKDVVVTYQEKTASFTITVNAPVVPELVSIRVTAPTKVEYAPGDQFDQSGMIVTAIFDDEHEEVISEGFTVSAPDMSVAGKQTVTVTYEGKTDSFEIHIFQVTITNKNNLQELWRVGVEKSVSVRIPGVTVTQALEDGDLVISTSDSEVLSINGLKVNAIKDGAATITATYKNEYSDSVDVTIDKELTYRIVTEFDSEHDYTLGLIASSGKIGFASIDMDGFYIASHLEIAEAGKVRITEDTTATDDYKYIIKITATVEGEEITKTVASYKGGGHVNIGFYEDRTTEYPFETALFKFNEDFSFSTMIDSEEFWIGTYGTYYTFSYRDESTVEYKARLYEEGEPIPATGVALDKTTLALETPKSEQLKATVTPLESTDFVEWSSSDESVAVVNSKGLVTAIEHGSAVITAKAGSVSATCAVTVTGDRFDFGTKEQPLDIDAALTLLERVGENVVTPQKMWVKGIATASEAEYVSGSNKNRGVTLQNNDGSNKSAFTLYRAVIDVMDPSLKDLPSTANALRGKEVVAEGYGKLYVKGTTRTPELSVENDTSPIVRSAATPTFPEATGFVLDKNELELAPNASGTLVASVTPTVIVPDIVWTSSNEAAATVDSEGKVTAVANGATTITATFGELTATCAVTVAGEAINYGTEDNPLTPTQAKALLDAHTTGGGFTDQEIWIAGTVSSASYSSKYSNWTIWLYEDTEAHGFELYATVLGTGVDSEKLVDGATLVAHGYAKKFTQDENTTYECAQYNPGTGMVYPTVTSATVEEHDLEDITVNDASLNMGEDKQLTVTPVPSTASLEGISYVSGDAGIVTISETGLMHPVATGTTTITITVGTIVKQINVTVSAALNYGSQDNPLTVAQAKALIDNFDPNELTAQKVWVKGYVAEVESYAYASRNIWLAETEGSTDHDFEVYSAQPDSGFAVDFSNNEQVEEHINGMVIVACGWAKLYKSTSDPSKPQVYELTDKSDHTDKPLVYSSEAPTLQSISLSESALNLAPLGEATLTATASPAKASLEGITWVSSDPSVATVENGVVHALAAGSTTITASVGTVESEGCVVTVQAAANPATSCEISATEIAINVGGSNDLTSTASPTDTTDVAVWSSNNEEVATVDQTGHVVGVAAGTATITVRYNATVSANCVVTVSTEPGKSPDNPLSPLDAYNIGKTIEYGKTSDELYYVKGIITSFFGSTDAYLDGSPFEVSTSLSGYDSTKFVIGAEVLVYGKLYSGGNNFTKIDSATGSFVSMDVSETKMVKITGDASVGVGGELQLTGATFPTAVGATLTWSISDTTGEIATIDQTGKVTGVAVGNVTVTATASDNGVFATKDIEITAQSYSSLVIPVAGSSFTTHNNDHGEFTSGIATIEINKADSTSNIRYSDTDHLRIYSGAQLVISISSGTLAKVELTLTATSYVSLVTTPAGASVSVEGAVLTYTLPADATSVTFAGTGQWRINNIKLYYIAA